MTEILSYYREGKSKELLVDHVSAALEIVSAENSKLFRFAERYQADFRQMVRLAVIFHDSGKIFYQFRRGGVGEKYMSFRGHEYLSTYIFSIFANKLIELDLENYEKYSLLRDVGTFAIYFHHHAMNVRLREPEMKGDTVKLGVSLLNVFVEDVVQFLSPEEVVAIKNAAKTIASQKPEDIANGVVGYVRERMNELWRKIMDNPRLRKLSYSALLALTTADYLAAQKNRKSGKTWFGRVLEEFRRLYL